MRCIESVEAGDEGSLEFLLRSRLRAADKRYIGFLIAGVARHMATNLE